MRSAGGGCGQATRKACLFEVGLSGYSDGGKSCPSGGKVTLSSAVSRARSSGSLYVRGARYGETWE